MDIKKDQTMINEILSLRYHPSLEIKRKKYSPRDFEPQENSNHLEFIENAIVNSIKKEISDEEVSVALSGGVDSALVTVLLRNTIPDIKINAISVKFADSVDETKIAENIAKKCNAEHHIISIENFLEDLPKAISIIKMPFWDTHWYHMVKTAKQFSTNLISGDGGDELFGGYTFRYKKFLSNYNTSMSALDKTKLYLDCHERDWVPDQEELFGKKTNFSWDDIYAKIIPFFDNSLSPLDQIFLADMNGKLLFNWMPVNARFHEYFDLKSITPILSNELIEYALHLKNSIKYNQKENVGKLPLREILGNYIDPNLLTPKKQGFSVDTINLWKSYGRKLCDYYLKDSRIVQDKWINKEWIEKHFKKLEDNLDVRYVNKFLGLLACEVWYRIFITNEMKESTKLSI